MARVGELIGKLGLLFLLGMGVGVLGFELKQLWRLRYRLRSSNADLVFIILAATILVGGLIVCFLAFVDVFCGTFLGG